MFFCYFQPVLEPCGQTAEKNTQSAPKWSYFRPFPRGKKGSGKKSQTDSQKSQNGAQFDLMFAHGKGNGCSFCYISFSPALSALYLLTNPLTGCSSTLGHPKD